MHPASLAWKQGLYVPRLPEPSMYITLERRIAQLVAQYRSKEAFCEVHKVTLEDLADILAGVREPSAEELAKLGLRRVVMYSTIDRR